MKVGDLIDLLSKCPRNDLVIIDTDTEDVNIDADITDVLVGNGTLKGFSFLKLENVEISDKEL